MFHIALCEQILYEFARVLNILNLGHAFRDISKTSIDPSGACMRRASSTFSPRVPLIALLFACLALSGCTDKKQIQPVQSGLAPSLDSPPTSSERKVPHPPSVAVIEYDERGYLFPCTQSNSVKPQCQEAVALRYIEQSKEQAGTRTLNVITFVHGWHHNAKWDSYNFTNFQRLIDCLNWGSADYAAIYPHSDHGDATATCANVRRDDSKRYIGIYLGWRGESMKHLTFMSVKNRMNAAARVSGGDVKNTLMKLGNAAKEGTAARLIVIGHSFGGLIVGRATEDLLSQAFTASGPAFPPGGCGDGTQGHHGFADLVVLLNAADNSARGAHLMSVMKQQANNNPSYFCQQGSKLNSALARPIVIAIHTPSDRATGDLGALGLWLAHIDGGSDLRGSTNLQPEPNKPVPPEGVPDFDVLRKKPLNHLTYLHNTCYLDQQNTGDYVCNGLNDKLYELKKTAFTNVIKTPNPKIHDPAIDGGSRDPFYHGAYELALSVCKMGGEVGSEYDPPDCDADKLAERQRLVDEFYRLLAQYLAFPEANGQSRDSTLLDLYVRPLLGCNRHNVKNPPSRCVPQGGDMHGAVWNNTPFWEVNQSYEVFQKHNGFWNSDMISLITQIESQFPILPD